jgi:hypothetical protein
LAGAEQVGAEASSGDAQRASITKVPLAPTSGLASAIACTKRQSVTRAEKV